MCLSAIHFRALIIASTCAFSCWLFRFRNCSSSCCRRTRASFSSCSRRVTRSSSNLRSLNITRTWKNSCWRHNSEYTWSVCSNRICVTLSCKICFFNVSAFLSIDSSLPRFSSLPSSVASALREPKLIDDANIVSYAKCANYRTIQKISTFNKPDRVIFISSLMRTKSTPVSGDSIDTWRINSSISSA